MANIHRVVPSLVWFTALFYWGIYTFLPFGTKSSFPWTHIYLLTLLWLTVSIVYAVLKANSAIEYFLWSGLFLLIASQEFMFGYGVLGAHPVIDWSILLLGSASCLLLLGKGGTFVVHLSNGQ
jgi:hypothetical protein